MILAAVKNSQLPPRGTARDVRKPRIRAAGAPCGGSSSVIISPLKKKACRQSNDSGGRGWAPALDREKGCLTRPSGRFERRSRNMVRLYGRGHGREVIDMSQGPGDDHFRSRISADRGAPMVPTAMTENVLAMSAMPRQH